jgi:hypothetical protein
MEAETFSKAVLILHMESGWEEFDRYIKSLTTEQLTGPVDAVGWTVRDHILHLAIWEESVCGLLDGEPRWDSFGIDRETWESHSYDRINEAIQQKHQAITVAEVLHMFREAHEHLVSRTKALTDEDLLKPYRVYQPDSSKEDPVYNWISGNSFEHYAEHRPWIEAILAAS